jgi:hypothetical protein
LFKNIEIVHLGRGHDNPFQVIKKFEEKEASSRISWN